MSINETKIVRDSEVVRLHKENLSDSEISKRLDIPRSTIYSIIKKYEKHDTVLRLSGSGRKKSLDDSDIQIILNEIEKNPFTSSESIKNEIEKTTKKSVTSRTVRNYIKDTSYRSRVPRKVPKLSKSNIKRRLDLANEWSSWEESDWDKVIWSDETKINLFSSDGRQRVYRKKGKALESKNCLPTIKHGGGSIMLWGCMSSKGVGRLHIIKGKMDGLMYKSILTKNLGPSARDMGLDDEFVFQQDNDPKHTSRVVGEYFIFKNVNVLDWPAQSPDLNPIEHLWDYVKREVRKRKPTNLRELEQYVIEIWENIDSELCKRLVKTMNDRVNCVIRAKGKHIPY